MIELRLEPRCVCDIQFSVLFLRQGKSISEVLIAILKDTQPSSISKLSENND